MANVKGKEYWDNWVSYVADNVGKVNMQQIADHMGVSLRSLTDHIRQWRIEGLVGTADMRIHNGPKASPEPKVRKKKAIKELSERSINGVVYLYKHIGNSKYKCMGRKGSQGNKLKPGPKQGTKKKTMPVPRTPKKEVVKLPTKQVDQSKMKSVRVDSRTTIQVPIEMEDSVAIDNWKKKYNKA